MPAVKRHGKVVVGEKTVFRVAVTVAIVAAGLAILFGALRLRALHLSSHVEASIVSCTRSGSGGSEGDIYRVTAALADGRQVEFHMTLPRPYKPGDRVTLRIIESTGRVLHEEFVYWVPTIVSAGIAVLGFVAALGVKGAWTRSSDPGGRTQQVESPPREEGK